MSNLHMLIKQKCPSLPRNLALGTFGELLIMVNLLYLLYSTPPEVLSSASDKAKLFAQNFSKNSNLDDSGTSLPVFPSRTNLKLHNISVTPKMFKKVITNLDSSEASGIVRKGVSTPPPPPFQNLPPPLLGSATSSIFKTPHPCTFPANRSSQVFLINRNGTVKLSSINTIHVKQQHKIGFSIFPFTIKYMLGNVYVNKMHVRQCISSFCRGFPILSISLLYPKESFTFSCFEQLGRKDFSMEQLPIDSYMLLCKQKNSISINQ